MKKTVIVILIILLISCLVACHEEECTHQWIEESRWEGDCRHMVEITYRCSICGISKIEIIEEYGPHAFDLVASNPATCTESGFEEYSCDRCSKVKVISLDALGHTEVNVEGTPTSCKESGLSNGVYCTECYTWLVQQTYIPRLPHTYDDDYDAICNECGHERDAKCAHTNKVTIEGEEATCTQPGYTDGKKCLDCDEVIVAQEVIDALGHNESDWIVDKAPTVTENGTHHKECTNCGMLYTTETLYATGSEGLTYTLNDDQTYTVSGAGCTDANVFIPEYYNGLPIKEIGGFTRNTAIESLTLLGDVQTINPDAFRGCSNLKSVSFLGDLYEIYACAFAQCSNITEIILPETVTYVGQLAFDRCESLEYLYIPAGLDDLAINFEGNEWLLFSDFYSGDIVIEVDSKNNSYKSVDGSLYSKDGKILYHACCKNLERDENGLCEFIIPDGVTTIHSGAFNYNIKLKSITIPNSVTSFATYSFHWTYSLESIYYNGTYDEWEKIDKGWNWDMNAGVGTANKLYTLYCE